MRQNLTPFSKRTKADIYLEWVNDWLTIERFADNYNRTIEQMEKIIKEGREEHESNVRKYKESLSNLS